MARQPLPKKYRFKPLSMGDQPRYGSKLSNLIGQCAAWSAACESQLALLMGALLGVENYASVAVFATLQNGRARSEALRAAAKYSLQDEDIEIFNAIIGVHKALETERNDIVHGRWGGIADDPDAVLWCSVANYAAWHIMDYHKGVQGNLSSEWRQNQFLENCYIWQLSDIEATAHSLQKLSMLIMNFHALLRYRNEPSGANALKRLMADQMLQKALSEQKNGSKTRNK